MNARTSKHTLSLISLVLLLALAGPAAGGAGDAVVEASFDDARGFDSRLAPTARIVTILVDSEPGEPVLIVIPIDPVPLVLRLEPHSVRSAGYRVLVQREDGALEEVESGPVKTLRGSVVNIPGSVVAGALVEGGLSARIVLPGADDVWIEPLRGNEPIPGRHVVYGAEDILRRGGICEVRAAADADDDDASTSEGAPPPTLTSRTGPVRRPTMLAAGSVAVAKLAADADVEYYQAYGSVQAVEDRINSIINAVNVQYERDVAISHVVTAIVVRTAEPDPYDSVFSAVLLQQFEDHWLSNHADIERDVAHLFTGRDLWGAQLGYAWSSSICTDSAFSVAQSDGLPTFAEVTDLTAHELGHNWGADHCVCLDDSDYTMTASIHGSNIFHAVETMPEIIAFRDTLTCLDEPIVGDLDGSGTVDTVDLLALLAAWGDCPDPPAVCPADFDGDGMVGVTDLLAQLANWG